MARVHRNSLYPARHPRQARWYVYAGSVHIGFMTFTVGPTYDWADATMNDLPLKWAGYYEPSPILLKKIANDAGIDEGIDDMDDEEAS